MKRNSSDVPLKSVQGLELPVYKKELAGSAYVLYYTPGYLAKVRAEDAQRFDFMLSGAMDDPVAQALRRYAGQAQSDWNDFLHAPFEPVSLNLYLNRKCNSFCVYCYADARPDDTEELQIDEVKAAIHLVAGNCQRKKTPFTLVVHGGGEPTLSFPLLEMTVDYAWTVADELGLRLIRYIATNGVISERKAQWIAEHFDAVGLSCDGPQAIQRRQRPLRNGVSSTPFVERSAKIFRDGGVNLQVRVTLTPETYEAQPQIAQYLCEVIRPTLIHVEPVYSGGRSQENVKMSDTQADGFVSSFLSARKIASNFNVHWMLSGSRPAGVHGAYCNPFRQVLNLIPGGLATSCFKTVKAGQMTGEHLRTAFYDKTAQHISIEAWNVADFSNRYRKPAICRDCFLEYHCTHGCPDVCPFEQTDAPGRLCRVFQQLALRSIREAAASFDIPTTSIAAGKALTLTDW